eukprot:3222419-Pleurochrysis_carterae.AAC.1
MASAALMFKKAVSTLDMSDLVRISAASSCGDFDEAVRDGRQRLAAREEPVRKLGVESATQTGIRIGEKSAERERGGAGRSEEHADTASSWRNRRAQVGSDSWDPNVAIPVGTLTSQ